MTALPAWVADYVGLPFKEKGRDRSGVDCWGLVRLVLAERFGIEVPSYVEEYGSTKERETIGAVIAREVQPPWVEVLPGQERPGDVVLMRRGRHPIHVGLVVAPGRMLHVEEGIEACVEDYRGLAWSRRVVGIWRWSARC